MKIEGAEGTRDRAREREGEREGERAVMSVKPGSRDRRGILHEINCSLFHTDRDGSRCCFFLRDNSFPSPLSYLPPSVFCLNPPSLPPSHSFPLSLLPSLPPFCSSSLTSPTGLFSYSFSSHLTDGVKHT